MGRVRRAEEDADQEPSQQDAAPAVYFVHNGEECGPSTMVESTADNGETVSLLDVLKHYLRTVPAQDVRVVNAVTDELSLEDLLVYFRELLEEHKEEGVTTASGKGKWESYDRIRKIVPSSVLHDYFMSTCTTAEKYYSFVRVVSNQLGVHSAVAMLSSRGKWSADQLVVSCASGMLMSAGSAPRGFGGGTEPGNMAEEIVKSGDSNGNCLRNTPNVKALLDSYPSATSGILSTAMYCTLQSLAASRLELEVRTFEHMGWIYVL